MDAPTKKSAVTGMVLQSRMVGTSAAALDLILISPIPELRLRGPDLRHRAGHVGFASPRGMALIAAETRELLCSLGTS
jgi:hypothetical protein